MNDSRYLHWQEKIRAGGLFRDWWLFWGIYSTLLIFAAAVYLLAVGRWQAVVLAAAAFILARLIISPLIYLFYRERRPYQALQFTPVKSMLFSMPTARANAFPSDHAASFASIIAALAWRAPWLGLALVIVLALNGLGRVVLGYHYPNQVLAGWLVGL
ncbi:MAG TPA: phosphatase PAP2 family protein, partial [Patescibacteria group bacterium]|nr:phosphatase PAP2 family protein [Patescibacteria group bacterium]